MKIELYTVTVSGAETTHHLWLDDAKADADKAQTQDATAKVVITKWNQNLLTDTVVYEATKEETQTQAEPTIMTTNQIIATVKALKVGDDVTVNGFTVVKYGKKNYHVFLGAAYTSPTVFGSLSDAYTVAIKIGTKTSKAAA